MSSAVPVRATTSIPVLLLKTRAQPHDVYEEYFEQAVSSTSTSSASTSGRLSGSPRSPSVPSPIQFLPQFIPVLEHKQNEEILDELGQLLKSGTLKERYGGMIFTSQRAVEGWAETVLKAESEIRDGESDLTNQLELQNTAIDARTGEPFTTDIQTNTPFPLYVVGPATARALGTLLTTISSRQPQSRSPSTFLSLQPEIFGSHTGSGQVLAPFILHHYNTLHARTLFTYHDAPRLPFIPLLGMGSENYSRRRLETSDPRLRKKPLCFLVGETRRDIIPKTLADEGLGSGKVEVDEVEVYRTVVKEGFRQEFGDVVARSHGEARPVVVVVVFSPQGSGDMLKTLEFVDEEGKITEKARRRWEEHAGWSDAHPYGSGAGDGPQGREPRYVVATIGPTTRDHLVDTFGFEPDVCANKPSPDGIGEEVRAFLAAKGLV